jgi:ATP-dependent helicase/DNAse subunit B
MVKDKYSALWVSYSSINDFLNCPRAYYLRYVYKDPKTGHKLSLMAPPLALGQAVHEVIESLSVLPALQRFKQPLAERLDQAWEKVSGKKGGFSSSEQERKFKERGQKMLRKILDKPGPLAGLAVKIKMELPQFWLSEEENIILCGKIDWLEYLKESDSVHVIDFKTGKPGRDKNSLQLAIYQLLASHCQDRKVKKLSYWYLEQSDQPVQHKLTDEDETFEKVLKIAKQMKLARQLGRFRCPENGCRFCKPFETIINGGAELVGVNNHQADVYILPDINLNDLAESEIL